MHCCSFTVMHARNLPGDQCRLKMAQDAKYNPVRAVLESIPSRGAAKYDMVGSLLENTVLPQRGQNERSKYDVVWQLLRAGREGGATASPKFDPVCFCSPAQSV